MHQCLACGHTFADEEAVQVLRGCRQCKGTKFYYTEKHLTEAERAEITKRAQQDVREVVAQMLKAEAPDALEEGRDWAELKPKDLRRIVKAVQKKREDKANNAGGWEYEDATPIGLPGKEARRTVEETIGEKAKDRRPDTVQAGDGAYAIDVKSLLERNPIVVHKDGAYMIHLPSLFSQDKD